MNLSVLLQGFVLGGSLIVAIGAQNAFVLRQGLLRQHPFATAFICTVCDVLLILLGVAGLGALIASSQLLTQLARWGGAAFLLVFGFLSFRAAFAPADVHPLDTARGEADLRRVLLAALGFSLLNPHVYLDTVVLLGSIGSQFVAQERTSFAVGAILASAVWFFGLVYAAGRLTPLFRRPQAWQWMNLGIGVVMWAIGLSLIRGGVH